MDRTLTIGTSCDAHLARALGFEASLLELERRYFAGEMTNREVALRDAGHYRGRKRADMVPLLQSLPRIGGIGETVKTLHGEGIVVILNTIGWSFIAEEFQREFGFDAVSGVIAGEDPPGVFNGIIDRHFDEHDKVTFAAAFFGGKGIAMVEVAAVGDSKSDIPLFEKVGLAIALNATPAAREAADVCFDADDLTVVLAPILGRSSDTK